MDADQMQVFEALWRGRLIFPFQDELAGLREEDGSGGLTTDEQGRREVLEGAYKRVKEKDEVFHKAMVTGNDAQALTAAEEALVIIQEIP